MILLMSFVVMGLVIVGKGGYDVVLLGLCFICESVWVDGSWLIDMNLVMWMMMFFVVFLLVFLDIGGGDDKNFEDKEFFVVV